MPVKTGTGGRTPAGTEDDVSATGGEEISSWTGADGVGSTTGADEVGSGAEDVGSATGTEEDGGNGGSMYPLPVGNGLWPPQKVCSHEEYSTSR